MAKLQHQNDDTNREKEHRKYAETTFPAVLLEQPIQRQETQFEEHLTEEIWHFNRRKKMNQCERSSEIERDAFEFKNTRIIF